MRPLIDEGWALIKAIHCDLRDAFDGPNFPDINSPQAEALFKIYSTAGRLEHEIKKQRDKNLPSGAITLSPATIDRLRDLVHEVEERFLIEHLNPDSVQAQNGRRSLQVLVKLFDEVFPRHSTHNETPVSGLDAETVAEPGAGVESASGEG